MTPDQQFARLVNLPCSALWMVFLYTADTADAINAASRGDACGD